MYYGDRPVPRLYIYDALGLYMNVFKLQISTVPCGSVVMAPVLVSDLHELKGSCPGFGEVSEDEPVCHRQRSPKVRGGKRAFQFVDFRS